MINSRRLLWLLALFPWFDFLIRVTLPSFVGSVWDELFIITLIVVIYLEQRDKQELRYQLIPNSVKLPFLFLIVFSLSSIVVNVVPLEVSFDVLRVVYQPMFFIILTMYVLDDEKKLDTFMKIIIISTIFIALAGIIQYIFQIESVRWVHKKDADQFRIVSIFANPNALAGYLNMILSFLVALFLFTKQIKYKLLYLLAILPIFVALLLTFSRGAWIAFFFMAIYAVWVWNKKWLLTLPAILVALPFVMPASVVNRFAYLLDPSYYQMSSDYGRLAFWTDALIKIKENPIFGLGLGMYGDSVPLRHNIPFSTWVDNHYLKLGAEMGIFGLVSILVLLFALFQLTRKLFKQADSDKYRAYCIGLSGVIITMSVQNVTASIWEVLTDAIIFYGFIGMLFAFVWRFNQKGKS
ncbi:MAG: O-antigen ligase family protein [Vulcanibacillus sp.]